MKKANKALTLAMTGMLALTFAACGGNGGSSSGSASSASAASESAASESATSASAAASSAASSAASGAEGAGDTTEAGGSFKVGICNYVDDASLNQIVDNIQAALSTYADQGVEIEVQYDNCNADANVLDQIIANFIADDVDLMVGVATPVAMAMQAATEDNQIPVVFAAVSDPVGTGVVDSLEAPGANITGSSDALDTSAIMNLVFAQNPDASNIGLLYDVGQDSSTAAIEEAKTYLEDKGVSYTEFTGTNVTEVVQAAQAAVDAGVDAIFTPQDNTVMTAELSIYEMLAEAGIPHYTGADSFALNGAFLGYGVDYANLGRETGDMVADILINGLDVATYPVLTFDNGTATVNTEICEQLGIDFDEVAATFAPYCTQVLPITTAESFDDLEG